MWSLVLECVRFRFLMLLIVAASGTVGQSIITTERQATLIIHLLDNFGGDQLGGELSVFATGGERVYSRATASEVSVRLPYGEYTIEFEGEFLLAVRRKVEVNRPEVFVVVATGMEPIVLDIPIPLMSISIKLSPSQSCSPGGVLWAKLVGVYSAYGTEQRVSARGYALFEPLEIGTYLVMIVDGKQVRTTKAIVTEGPVTVVNIPLPVCEGQAK